MATGEFKKGTTGNDNLVGTMYDDTLEGLAGDDFLAGDEGNDTLIGGPGNDDLEGYEGDDTYEFSNGDGVDRVLYDDEGSNTLVFKDSNRAEVRTQKVLAGPSSEDDLVLWYNGGKDRVLLCNYFGDDLSWKTTTVDTIRFADQTLTGTALQTWLASATTDQPVFLSTDQELRGDAGANRLTGGKGNDSLYGLAGNDTLTGGKGNDVLTGGAGKDTFIINTGDGHDTITDAGAKDVLKLGSGIVKADLAAKQKGNDLVLSIINADQTVTLKDWWKQDKSARLAGVTLQDKSKVKFDSLLPPTFDEYIRVSNGNNNRTGTKGNDYISGSGGNDTLTGGAGNDWFNGADGDDFIYGGKGDDTLGGRQGNNYLDGGSGNDVLFALAGNDTLIGGTGDDELSGDNGDDIYIFKAGAGKDSLRDAAGDNTLVFKGVKQAETSLFRTGDHLLLRYGSGGDQLCLIDWFYHQNPTQISEIRFADTTLKGEVLTAWFNRASAQTGVSSPAVTFDQEIEGSAGNDQKTGTEGNDFFETYQGDDTLHGLGGQDYLSGAWGDDKLYGGEGNDTLVGYRGNDYLEGGPGDDYLSVGGGDYTADHSGFEDAASTLIGGTGDDHLSGEDGDDTYIFNVGDGKDTVADPKGRNTLVFNGIKMADVTKTHEVNHLVLHYGQGDEVWLKDWFYDYKPTVISNIQFADRTLEGKELRSWLSSFTEGSDMLVGSPSNDKLTGLSGDDTIWGYEGNDKLYGKGGDDSLLGGTGKDTLDGGAGNDTLIGGEGKDSLIGGAGKDTFIINKGDGHDTITDATSQDTLKFGTGITASDLSAKLNGKNLVLRIGTAQSVTLKNWKTASKPLSQVILSNGKKIKLNDLLNGGGGGGTGILLRGSEGHDYLAGGEGDDTLYGGAGNDTLSGGAGNDLLDGGAGNDKLYGGTGNDYLSGGAGNDYLTGGAGNDLISGGAGRDTLSGGAGRDRFVFDTALNKKTNVDIITDFEKGEDGIQLQKSIFAKLKEGRLNAANFRASTNGLAGDSNDYILYNTKTGALLYDADGSGKGAAIQFATLQNKPQNMTASAFIVA